MRALKWIAGGLIALVLVIFLVGYIYLAGMDFNTMKPEIARAVEKGTGRKLTMAGDIKLNISLSPSLALEDISLANAPWGKRPQMLSVHKAEVEVDLWPLLTQSRLEVNRLILDKPDILLEIDKQGRSNLDMQPQKTAPGKKTVAKPKADSAGSAAIKDAESGKELSLSFRKVLIKDGQLALDDRKDGKKFNLKLDKLALDSKGPSSEAGLELKGSVDGQKFEAKGEFEPAAVLFGKFDNPLKLKLAAEALGLKLKLKGKVKELAKFADFKFDVELSSTEDAKWGKEKLKDGFKFKAKFKDAKPKVYVLSGLELKAGGTELKGNLSADLSGKRPEVKAKLKAGTVDLRPFTGSKKDKESKPAQTAQTKSKDKKASVAKSAAKASGNDKVFPREKLDLAALRKADVELEFKAEKILSGKPELKDLGFNLSLQNGKMRLEKFKAKLAGGRNRA